jgi:hypothetical protein
MQAPEKLHLRRTAMRIVRRVGFTIGVLLAVLGVAVAAFGSVRTSFLAQTTGVVTEVMLPTVATSSTSRAVFYRYTVGGSTYSGMARLDLGDLADEAGRSNRSLLVFYKKGHPSTSYAVKRPSLIPWLGSGALFAMLGLLLAALTRDAKNSR